MGRTIEEINRVDCNGCKVCGDICPNKAISFETDTEGFWYPVINNDKCIRCGQCFNACSSRTIDNSREFQKQVYASWNKDKKIRRESTSGGVYTAFAKYILEEGGYIVGSVYSEDYRSAFHISGNSENDLKKIAGSKYFQSDTAGIYKDVLNLLEEGKKVLFTGTPCQVGGLKKFLNHQYDNLITIDFICRGVPSPLVHKKKIELYELRNKSKVTFYRDKWDKYAWIHFGELIRYENGKEQFISRWNDKINDCFVKHNLNVRMSCYRCQYKNGLNEAEITIGDFWGIKGVTEHDLTEGVSALIVNNEKGAEFLALVKKHLYLEQRTLPEIIKGNKAYIRPIDQPKGRESFFEDVNSEGLEATIRKIAIISKEDKKIARRRMRHMKLRRLLPLYKNRKIIDWPKFVKYNYFCRQIKREKGAYLIICKGGDVQLDKGGTVTLEANLFLNYYPCYKRVSRTSLLRVEKNGQLIIHNDVEIAYNNTISVDRGAILEMGHFYTGIGANIICKCRITIGNNVMLGRDVCLFDSDFHSIFDEKGKRINLDKEIIIEDNVWIGARSMVLKGSILREGTIVSANTMVMGETEAGRVFINRREKQSVGEHIIWER